MLQSTAEAAICSIGLGFNVVTDVWLKYCKQRGSTDPWLIDLDHAEVQDIVLPGGLTVAGITRSIKCGKRERMRFRSDVLSFQRMSGSSTCEALIVPFGDTCALVSVPFSSLGMASTFAKIEYFIQMVWIGAGSDNMYYQQIGKMYQYHYLCGICCLCVSANKDKDHVH